MRRNNMDAPATHLETDSDVEWLSAEADHDSLWSIREQHRNTVSKESTRKTA